MMTNEAIANLPADSKRLIWNYQQMLKEFVNHQLCQFTHNLVKVHEQEKLYKSKSKCKHHLRNRKDSGIISPEHHDATLSQTPPSPTTSRRNINSSPTEGIRQEENDNRDFELIKMLDQFQYENILPGEETITPETEKDKPKDEQACENKWKEIFQQNLEVNRNKPFECAFCKKNGELPIVYQSHSTKDDNGVVRCPILQEHVCDICGATGTEAHTKKYCPKNRPVSTYRHPALRLLANGVLVKNRSHK